MVKATAGNNTRHNRTSIDWVKLQLQLQPLLSGKIATVNNNEAIQMSSNWKEFGRLEKRNKNNKVRDRIRLFVNDLNWCKANSEKTSKEFWFNTIEELEVKLQTWNNLKFVSVMQMKLPTEINSRFQTSDEN